VRCSKSTEGRCFSRRRLSVRMSQFPAVGLIGAQASRVAPVAAIALSLLIQAGCGSRVPAPPDAPMGVDPVYSTVQLTLDSFDLTKGDAAFPPRASCHLVGEDRFQPRHCQPGTLIVSFVYMQGQREVHQGPSIVRPKVSGGTLHFEKDLRVPAKPGRYELRVEVMRTDRFQENCPSMSTGIICRGYVVVSSP